MRLYLPLYAIGFLAAAASAQDMPLTEVLVRGEGWKLLDQEYPSITSLTADRDGNVYVADRSLGFVDRIRLQPATSDAPAGKVSHTRLKVKAAVTGLCFGTDGKLYGCQPSRKHIVVFSSDGHQPVVEGLAAEQLVAATDGRFFCTVPTELAVYRVDANGKKQRVDESVVPPTGLTLWRDEGTLVIGYSESASLWACRIEKDGTLSAKERYYALRPPEGRAGGSVAQLTVDDKRRLYAATAEGVQVFDPTGRMSGVLSKPDRADVTALTIGGANHDQLFIACGKHLYVRKITTRGAFPLPAKR